MIILCVRDLKNIHIYIRGCIYKNLITEYLLCLSIMVIFIKKCMCVVTPDLAQTNISSITPQTEDDEDFVPYHGERFSTFDWMLFRVFKFILSLKNLI